MGVNGLFMFMIYLLFKIPKGKCNKLILLRLWDIYGEHLQNLFLSSSSGFYSNHASVWNIWSIWGIWSLSGTLAYAAFKHSDTQALRQSVSTALWHSGTQAFRYSGTQAPRHSDTQALRPSGIQAIRHSGIQVIRHSDTWALSVTSFWGIWGTRLEHLKSGLKTCYIGLISDPKNALWFWTKNQQKLI